VDVTARGGGLAAPARPRVRRTTSAIAVGIAAPGALILGALAFEHLGGLPPCEMCLWQRWALVAAMALAAVAAVVRRGVMQLPLLLASCVAVLASAGIALLHLGVEQDWWEGPTRCAALGPSGGSDFVSDLLATPLVRCDQVPWHLFGISLAGYNLLLSFLCAAVMTWLVLRTR
jgi:disulfide bond formation protein DsbB